MNKRQRKKREKQQLLTEYAAINNLTLKQARKSVFAMSEISRQLSGTYKQNPTNCSQAAISECGYDTSDAMFRQTRKNFEWLHELDIRMPSLRSTVESFSNLILSKPLQTSERQRPTELNDFMEANNISDQTNYDTFMQGIVHSLIYGRAGFRWMSKEKGFAFIPSDRYTVVYQENEEFLVSNEILGYVVARPNTKTPFGETMNLTENQRFFIDFDQDYGYNKDYVYVKKEDFYNLHFFGDSINVDTPLNHDIERIQLFLDLVTQLKNGIRKGNSEVTLIKLAEDLFNLDSKQASDLVTMSKQGKDAQQSTIISQVTAFGKTVADATGRDSLTVPPQVAETEIIEPTVAMSEYLKLYDYIETFISKLYGLSQNVLTLDSMPRDASANPIFEQMMKTTIYPKRKIVLQFFNNFILKKLKLKERVEFEHESYALGTDITNAQSMANVISTLYNAGIDPDANVVSMINNILLQS